LTIRKPSINVITIIVFVITLMEERTMALAVDHVRNGFGAIVQTGMRKQLAKEIENLIAGAKASPKISAQGGWEFGGQWDRKGRGYALNWDLYGISRDIHHRRRLIVVQVRQSWRRAASHFLNTRKSYFLVGRNEDDSVFCHCVSSQAIHAAIATKRDVVMAAQSWMFGHDYIKVLRQGDMGLIAVKRMSTPDVTFETPLILGGSSHVLSGEIILGKRDNTYVKNPHMHHVPGTHPDISGEGWFKVVQARQEGYYDFAAPSID
jgi:hypothetical protein